MPEAAPQEKRPWGSWLAILLFAGAFLLLLFYRGLVDTDEGRYAEIPREMLAGASVGEMHLLGYQYYEKPPLSYWLTAAAMRLFGITDSAARLPLLPIALLTAGACAWWARRAWGAPQGYGATAVAATALGFFVSMAILLTDNLLVLLLTLTVFCLYEAYRRPTAPGPGQAWLYGAAACAAGGTLTKGFIAVVLPAGILFFWLWWEGRLRQLWSWRLAGPLLLYVLILAPLCWLIEQSNPGFFRHFLVEEHLARFLGTRTIQGHPEPVWFYFQYLPIMLLPWTFFIFRMGQVMRRRQVLGRDDFSRLLVVWTAFIVAFFTASSGKLMSYIMPAIPPLGLLIGRWGVMATIEGGRDARLWRMGASLVPLAFLGLAGFWAVCYWDWFPDDFTPPAAASGLPWLAGALVLCGLITRRHLWTLPALFLLLGVVYLGFAVLLSPLSGPRFQGRVNIGSPIHKELATQLRAEDQILLFSYYRPSFAFYTRRIPWLLDEQNELQYGIQHEPRREPGYLEDRAALSNAMARYPGRWLALVRSDELDHLRQIVAIPATPIVANLDLQVYELLPPATWPALLPGPSEEPAP